MKKTNTKKSTSTKKSPVAAKVATPVVSQPVKKSAKAKAPVSKTPTKAKASTPTVKTATPKKAPAKKSAPKKPSVVHAEPIEAKKESPSATKTTKDGVKMLGILHLAANIISGGTLGVILVLGYYLLKRSELSQLEKETCFEILNFNISFLFYAFVLTISVVGLILLPLVILAWLVLLILGFMSHLEGKNYRYSFVIRFLS